MVDVCMREGFETKDDLVIRGNLYAKGKISCKTLSVEGDFFLEGELYCQELHVLGNSYVRGRVHMTYEGATAPVCCKVMSSGDFICEGLFVAHGGEVTIEGSLITTSMVRLGHTRVKVKEGICVGDLDCGQLNVAGDVNVKGMLDAKGRIYVLGDINSFELTSNLNSIFCGGKCNANLYSIGNVFEDVNDWKNVN